MYICYLGFLPGEDAESDPVCKHMLASNHLSVMQIFGAGMPLECDWPDPVSDVEGLMNGMALKCCRRHWIGLKSYFFENCDTQDMSLIPANSPHNFDPGETSAC